VAQGWIYDGRIAVRQPVTVEAAGDALVLSGAEGGDFEVPREALRFLEKRRDCEIYARVDQEGWRLGLGLEEAEALRPLLPAEERYGRLIDRFGLGRAAVAFLAVSALVVVAGMQFPSVAAPYVPASWEKNFGDSLVGDFGGRYCAGEGGQAALDKLALKLSPGAKSMKFRVVSAGVVNAAAFPGGNILIFDELLKESDGPDELAGVLAHEIAHVEERHTTETMIRQLGIGIFVAGFGGTTGSSIESLLAASYSRGAEDEADREAIEALSGANVSPLGTAGFFERLAKQESSLGRAAQPLSYLSSHPMSAERQKLFRDSAVRGRAYRPSLNRDEWEALFNICFNDPKREEKRLNLFF
jgi:hypothetical protein